MFPTEQNFHRGPRYRFRETPDGIELAPQGAETCVVLYPRSMMPEWEHLKPSIMFACHDIAATHAPLESRGVDFIEEPKEMAWGSFARFRDPDGNECVLTAPLQSGEA